VTEALLNDLFTRCPTIEILILHRCDLTNVSPTPSPHKVNWGDFVCGAIPYLCDFCYTMHVFAAPADVLPSYQ
jgi:hypothetical protein